MLIRNAHFCRIATLILALLATSSFMLGVVHIVLCSYFWNSAIGLWNSLILLTFAIYILRVKYAQPGTVALLLILIALTGLAILTLGLISLVFELFYHGARGPDAFASAADHPNAGGLYDVTWLNSFRLRLIGRSWNATYSCERMFDFLHFSNTMNEVARLVIYSLLILLGLFQVFVAGFLTAKLRALFSWDPELPHLHIILGSVSIAAGAVHIVYCCRYFYMISGIWAAVFCFAAGIYQTRTNFPYKAVTLLLNLLTLVSSATMTALAGIGLACWNINGPATFFELDPSRLRSNSTAILECIQEKDERLVLARLANGNLYQKCFTGLSLMGYWTPDGPYYARFAWPELKITQLVACATLVMTGILDFLLSIAIFIRTWIRDD